MKRPPLRAAGVFIAKTAGMLVFALVGGVVAFTLLGLLYGGVPGALCALGILLGRASAPCVVGPAG